MCINVSIFSNFLKIRFFGLRDARRCRKKGNLSFTKYWNHNADSLASDRECDSFQGTCPVRECPKHEYVDYLLESITQQLGGQLALPLLKWEWKAFQWSGGWRDGTCAICQWQGQGKDLATLAAKSRAFSLLWGVFFSASGGKNV